MVLSQYNSILDQQFNRVERSKRSLEKGFGNFLCNFSFSRNWILESKIDKVAEQETYFAGYVVMAKGLLALTRENIDVLTNNDLGRAITHLDGIIKSTVEYKEDVERLYSKGSEYKRAALKQTIEICEENINILFDCVRLLRKINTNPPISITSEGKLAVDISANTLRKLHAR